MSDQDQKTFQVTITAMVTKTYEVSAASEEQADDLASKQFSLEDDGVPAEYSQITNTISEGPVQPRKIKP